MKKTTLLILTFLLSFACFSQPAIQEGFEGSTLPVAGQWVLGSGTWGVFDNGVGLGQSWNVNSGIATPPLVYEGANAAYMNRENIGQGNTAQDYLASPLVTIPTNGQLRFYTRTTLNGDQGTVYKIMVAPAAAAQNDPAAYTLVQQYSESTLVDVFNIYQEKTVDLSAYAGTQIYVAFVMEFTQPGPGLSGDRWLVDDVRVIEKCLDPTDLAAVALSTSANLSWTNPGSATTFQVEVMPFASTDLPTGANAITVTGTSTTVTNTTTPVGPILPLTEYKYYVRAMCTDSSSDWVGPFSFTTQAAPPVCGGNYTDSGGITDEYTNNEDSTITICPTNPGDQVTVTFTSFNTEANYDGLYVFDGNSTASPQIASTNPAGNVPGGLAGAYWGTTVPGPFTSSSLDGCITFRFRTDGSGTRAGWIANVTCAPPPTCPKPTALVTSNITPTSVTLGWTNVGPGTSWEVISLPAGSPAPTATTVGTPVTTNPYVFTTLSSGTCYDFYVRAICASPDISLWSNPKTTCTPVAPPVCGGNYVDDGGVSANYTNGQDSTVTICPTNPGDQVTVTFTSFDTEETWDGLYVFDGNSTAAPQIASANPAGNVPGGLAGAYWGTTIPGPFTSSSLDGCLTFRFRSDGSVNHPGWLANVTCAPPPTCQKPTALTTTDITATSVTLGWTNIGAGTSWEVIALPCGSPPPTATSVGIVTTTNPYIFTGLASATCFDFYVRAICSPTDSSTWAGPKTATTPVAPPVCGGNFVDDGGLSANYTNGQDTTVTVCPTNPGDIVTVTFTSFDTEATWDGLYVFDGSTITAPQIASANPAGNVPGGLPGAYWGTAIPGPFTSSSIDGCLTFRFRSDGSVNHPGWVANVTCNPPPTCPKPNGLNAQFITQTSATLTWNQPANSDNFVATSWEIYVLPYGSGVPVSAGIATGNPYIVNGLAAGTAYTFYVRAICSSTDSSAWAGPFNFATPPVNDECSAAIFAPVNQDLSCTQTSSGTLIGATGSTQPSACGGTANDDTWFYFTALATAQIISFNNIGTATDLNFAVYQGDCDNLTQVACVLDNSGTVTGLVVGDMYRIRVYSTASNQQFNTNFTLCISTVPCATATPFCTGQVVTYPNAVGITPGLGEISCLFTSPNPAFFFLQVSTAGQLNYLMTQSTTPGGPANLDVDYALWGPFTDNASACAVIPNDNTYSCSYSAAPTENFSIANAQLCEIYVVMITNYSNMPGYITFTQTNTVGGGTTICYPFNTFNYPSNAYCQNAANPSPVLATGAVAGTYTASPPGLVIDPVTGVIDLAASTPGNYVVTSTTVPTSGGICPAIPDITTIRSITVTAVPDATISYANAQYCKSISQSQDVIIAGTAGGSFSSTNGLFLNGASGAIIPNLSTPGIYTVTYVIAAAGGCPAFTTTTQVEILASPVVPYINDVTVCDSYTLPVLTTGNYFTGSGGTGNPLNAGDIITETQTLYVYATNAICSDEKSFTITINTTPVIDPIENVTSCTDYTLPILAVGDYYTQTGGAGVQLHAGDVITTDQTIYVYATNGTCSAEISFTVTFGSLTADTSSDIVVCESYILPLLSANNSYYNGPGATLGEIAALTSLTSGQTVYIHAQQGTCSDESSFVVTINHAPVLPPISNVAACDSYTLASPAAGSHYFDGPGGTGTQLGDNAVITTPGTNTVYEYGQQGDCPSELSFTVTITASPVADALSDVTACDSYTLAALGVGNYYTATGGGGTAHFAGDVITASQLPMYVYAQSGTCSDETHFNITIGTTPDFVIDAGCQGSLYVLEVSAQNGTFDPQTATYAWSAGPGGEIVGSAAGQSVTVSGQADYSVTVTSPSCTSAPKSITVDNTTCTIQKGISPNGDGLNDYFDLVGQNVTKLEIFNRYGTVVYKKNNYSNQWVGQSDKGDELPDGTYYYVIERSSGPSKTGWIYINRERN